MNEIPVYRIAQILAEKSEADNKLNILTRNGLRVFSISGYENESQVFKGIGNFKAAGGTLPKETYLYVLEFRDKGERK